MRDGGVLYIGDTHIGKRFRTGVPLNRLGEREELIYEKFNVLLNESDPDIQMVVHLGDLFDRPTVSYDDLYKTYSLINAAAKNNPERTYIFIQGNHDLSRNIEMTTAIEVLRELLLPVKNVEFVLNFPVNIGNYLFVPYSFNQEFLSRHNDWTTGEGITLCGHFDEPFPHDIFNDYGKVITGHIHTPRQEFNINVVGSIIPMTFGEDPEGKLYRTLSLSDLEVALKEEGGENYCYRVILKEGEVLPEGVNCRQLISIKDDEQEILNTNLEEEWKDINLDIDYLMREALEDLGLYNEIYMKYLELKAETNV